MRERYIDNLVRYLLILYEWKGRYSPSISEVDDPDSRYVEAIREMPYADYLLKLLIDDEPLGELSSSDLIDYIDKISERMSSVHAPEA